LVADDAVAAGTAREVLEFLNEPGEWPHDARVAEALVDRATARGGSRHTVWGKPSLVCGGKGILPRKRLLREYVRALERGEPTGRLMRPFEDGGTPATRQGRPAAGDPGFLYRLCRDLPK
jgi:hypothetical protein